MYPLRPAPHALASTHRQCLPGTPGEIQRRQYLKQKLWQCVVITTTQILLKGLFSSRNILSSLARIKQWMVKINLKAVERENNVQGILEQKGLNCLSPLTCGCFSIQYSKFLLYDFLKHSDCVGG